MNLKIRIYRSGDEEKIREVALSSADFLKDYDLEGRTMFAMYIAPDAIAWRQAEDGATVVAEMDGMMVGVAEMREWKHLSMLFVMREWRGCGIARKMVDRLMALARAAKKGGKEFTVFAAPGSEGCYRQLGFEASGPQTSEQGIVYTPMLLKTK